MEFQTRSDNPLNDIKQHNTLSAAFAEYKSDPEVWKISFQNMRWRPKTHSNIWENEDCLCNLSIEYANERDLNKVFWVWQSIIPEKQVYEFIMKECYEGRITNEEAERRIDRANIREVLTEEQFKNKFQIN
jgi:hypothetical protein